MKKYDALHALGTIGIRYEDAVKLRRAAMTLHRWFEAECGDSNDYAAWAIERDETTDKPYMVRHNWYGGSGPAKVHKTLIPDREKGARKRIQDVMANYPGYGYYVQTDPRGSPLYIVPPNRMPQNGNLETCYNRGIAVCK
jgi:hypothetical protein